MKSLDTNVLARFFIDDPDDVESHRQRPIAARAMRGPVWVSVTVLLELEWVMRGFYALSTKDAVAVLRALCGLENATIEDRDHVLTAIAWHERGPGLRRRDASRAKAPVAMPTGNARSGAGPAVGEAGHPALHGARSLTPTLTPSTPSTTPEGDGARVA